MGLRSTVSQLPPEVQKDLDGRLVSGGFSDYAGLAAWLSEQGFEISKSALHRYGSKFEQRMAQLKTATSQAKAIVDASPDDENAVSDALMRLVQEKLFQLLVEADVDPEEPINLAKVARAVADLGRTTITQKKWQAEFRAKIEAAAATVETIARKGGLGKSAADQIRREILGITTK